MKPKIDRIILKIFSETPCLSPNRYTGFFILDYFLKSFFKKNVKYAILDAGCGTGIYADFLKESGFRGTYLGIDLEFKKDTFSYKSTKDFKIRFKKTNLDKVALNQKSSKGKFDLILSLWVLEHLRDDAKTLRLLKKHLKRKGLLILAVPSIYTWPFEFGRHGFRYYTSNKLKRLINLVGFKIIHFKRCGGPFGWFFVLFYDWLSFLVLVPALGLYKILGRLPRKKTREDLGSAQLSRKILNNTIFVYKKTRLGRKIHYNLVKIISRIDKKLPFLESSYFLILRAKDED